jgi:hypothetical protein
MDEKGGVKVFGMWASPMAIRVEWALRLKSVTYKNIDLDLTNKSDARAARLQHGDQEGSGAGPRRQADRRHHHHQVH